MKNQTVRGKNTTFHLGSTNLTPRLQEALRVLDRDCRRGSGGAWDIERIPGGWSATPRSILRYGILAWKDRNLAGLIWPVRGFPTVIY